MTPVDDTTPPPTPGSGEVTPPAPGRDLFRGGWLRLITVSHVTMFFLLWEVVAAAELVSSIFLPRPSSMLRALLDVALDGTLWSHLGFSMRNFAIGTLVATVTGIVLGVLAGGSAFSRRLLNPYIWVLASLPRIAWLPLLILVFGFSNMSKLVLIFMSAVFPIVINTMAGVQTVDEALLRAARVFGARAHERYLHVAIPQAIPFMVAGFKQGVTRALAAVVVSEMFGGSQGVGYLIVLAGQRFNTALLFSLLLFFVVVALLVVQAVDVAERRFVRWNAEVRV